MAKITRLLTVLGGLLLAATPTFAQSSNPVSFLTEMLGMRSRPADTAPMPITAPTPAKGKATSRAGAGAPTDITAATKQTKTPAKTAAKPKKPAPPPVTVAAADASADKQAAPTADATGAHPAPGIASPIDPVERKPVKLPPFRGGGSQAVCVRTCDGFFFPVNYEGAHSNDRYAEACQLACPASPTEVYFMPRGGDLTQASTQRGVRYSALPTAFRYRKERDETCSCKSQNQSWGEVLAQAEPLVKQNPKDIIVTPERSMELARPVDPAVVAAEAETAKTAKPQKTAGKTKAKDKKPATTLAAAKTKVAPDQAWRTTNRFVRIDPEPTASIR